MLIITLSDGSQIGVNVSVHAGAARTHVSHRATPFGAWSPVPAADVMRGAGWLTVEDAVRALAGKSVHLSTGAGVVKCGARMRDRDNPEGWDMGTSTVDPAAVTCEACK